MENILSTLPVCAGIYKLTNLINNKIYIGQTKYLRKRYLQYKCASTVNDTSFRSKRPIIYAIRKYGFENFSFEVLELTDNLDEREIYYISLYDSTNDKIGYNVEKGGQGISHPARLSEETRYRMGSRQRGKKVSKEAIAKRRKTRSALGQDYKVRCINDGKVFRSLRELREYYSKIFNVKPTSIHASEVIHGKRESDHGLVFELC